VVRAPGCYQHRRGDFTFDALPCEARLGGERAPAQRERKGGDPKKRRCMGVLQPKPESVVVGIAEVGVSLPFEGGDLGCDLAEVAGYVLDGVVPGPWVHLLMIRRADRFAKAF
jgi:hypothetical protein